MTDLAYGDDGELVAVQQFDFDQVEQPADRDRDLPPADAGRSLSPEDIEPALTLFRALVRWLWQDGMRNPNGLQIRAIIICWIFLDELHAHTLTSVARGFGRHKQSLGRWADQFKRTFPTVRTVHSKPLRKNPPKRHARANAQSPTPGSSPGN